MSALTDRTALEYRVTVGQAPGSGPGSEVQILSPTTNSFRFSDLRRLCRPPGVSVFGKVPIVSDVVDFVCGRIFRDTKANDAEDEAVLFFSRVF